MTVKMQEQMMKIIRQLAEPINPKIDAFTHLQHLQAQAFKLLDEYNRRNL